MNPRSRAALGRARATYDAQMGTGSIDLARGFRSAFAGRGRLETSCATAAAVFALAWPFFVFVGDQLAYLLATAAMAALALMLSANRSPYAVILVVGLAAVVGTEARGELGDGSAPLGSLRILDVALLFALLGAAWARVSAGRVPELLRRSRPGILGVLAALLVGWAGVLWIVAGAPRNQFLNTDIRLLVLVVGTYLVARALPRDVQGVVVRGLVLLSPLLLLKALAIVALDLDAIGTNDRIQATAVEIDGDRRVVLVGGDTLLILVPALWAGLRTRVPRARRWIFSASAICAVVGLLISGTRTSVLVAGALWAATEVAILAQRGQLPSRGTVTKLAVGALLLGIAGFSSGVAQRLEQGDTAHTGLNFRIDEIRTASHLPKWDLAVGQGLAGTFTSKDVHGQPIRTPWSHVLPVWLILKVGYAGACVALLLLGLFIRRGARAGTTAPDFVSTSGLLVVVGLVVMSLTLGRIALPEGAVLLGLGCALVSFQPVKARSS